MGINQRGEANKEANGSGYKTGQVCTSIEISDILCWTKMNEDKCKHILQGTISLGHSYENMQPFVTKVSTHSTLDCFLSLL